MSGIFTLITCAEILVACLLVIGFKNEKKLIDFENLIIRFVAALIRENKRKKCKMKNAQMRAQRAREAALAAEKNESFDKLADNVVYFGDYVA